MKALPHGKKFILWQLQTADHRVRRIDLLRMVPGEAYDELLEQGEIAEYRINKKVFVTLSLKALEWWRQR